MLNKPRKQSLVRIPIGVINSSNVIVLINAIRHDMREAMNEVESYDDFITFINWLGVTDELEIRMYAL
jgi:hypothetical protein